MNQDIRDQYKVKAGERLRQTRQALGFRSQREFAKITGESEANLSNWERGVSAVPPAYVSRLKNRFGVSLDWIFHGDLSMLPHSLAQELLKPQEMDDK
ncbi:MAG: helix-turn-helix transcriptional regulator [Kiloniellaceae bacterium]